MFRREEQGEEVDIGRQSQGLAAFQSLQVNFQVVGLSVRQFFSQSSY